MRTITAGCLAIIALLAPPALAGVVTIEEVGLGGHFSTDSLAPVHVRVANPGSDPLTVRLRFLMHPDDRPGFTAVDIVSLDVALAGGEARTIDVPLLVITSEVLEVTAESATGAHLGTDSRRLGSGGMNRLVALLCTDEAVCQALQTRISFSGSDEDRVTKRKALAFAVVRDPPGAWWGYAHTMVVVVARPLGGLSVLQQGALEGFVRHGGQVVVVEDLVGQSNFLAAYRPGRATDGERLLAQGGRVGLGRLHRVPGVGSRELDTTFSGATLAAIFWARQIGGRGRWPESELTWTQMRVETAPTFPGLGWIVAWLAVYVAVVGIGNFALLRRRGRVDWGWITVPIIALVFAGGLYATTVARRPATFIVDEVAVYWMDDLSPMASTEAAVHLISPWRDTATLSVPGDAVISERPAQSFSMLVNGLRPQGATPAREIRLGAVQQVALPLLEWSSIDVFFRTLRRLPGTVRLAIPRRLRNETGRSFVDAVYVERDAVYMLGAWPAGAETDLAVARREPLTKHTNRLGPASTTLTQPRLLQDYPRVRPGDGIPQGPFKLVELIGGWPPDGANAFDGRAGIFFGLVSEPALGAEVVGRRFVRNGHAVVIVSIGGAR